MPIRVFWFDVAYIIVGFSVFFYTMSFIDGPYLLDYSYLFNRSGDSGFFIYTAAADCAFGSFWLSR